MYLYKQFLFTLFAEEDCRSDLLNTNLNDLFPGCLRTYSSDSEDRTPFHLPQWIPLRNYSHFASVNDICPKPWRYQSATKIHTLSHDAVKETYDGGGYVADLGYNKESALEVVNGLRAHSWVDERTVAVFIEFTLFDPSSSLFCNVRNVYERLATGQVVTAVDVRALSLYPLQDVNFQSFYEVCQLLFLVVIIVFSIGEIVKFFRQKVYLRQVWNWVQLILLVVSFVAMVVSILKGKHTHLYVKKIQTNPYETFSSDSIVRLLDWETFWLSAAIFVVTLKLLRLIRFNPHICQMQGTLKRSARPILSFSLVMAIAILAFTQFGFLCFGAKLVTFSSFFKALRVVLQMSVGKSINNVEVHLQYPILGPLFLFFFLVGILFILINVFVAVLVDSYGEVREEQGETGFADADLGAFMYNVLWKNITKKIAIGKLKNTSPKSLRETDSRCSGESNADSNHDDGLDDIDFAIFEPVKNSKCSSPIFWPRCPQECFKYDSLNDAVNINEIDKDGDLFADIKTGSLEKSSKIKSLNTATKAAIFPQCPQECFDADSETSVADKEQILNEEVLLDYIKARFMEIAAEVKPSSIWSKGH